MYENGLTRYSMEDGYESHLLIEIVGGGVILGLVEIVVHRHCPGLIQEQLEVPVYKNCGEKKVCNMI